MLSKLSKKELLMKKNAPNVQKWKESLRALKPFT